MRIGNIRLIYIQSIETAFIFPALLDMIIVRHHLFLRCCCFRHCCNSLSLLWSIAGKNGFYFGSLLSSAMANGPSSIISGKALFNALFNVQPLSLIIQWTVTKLIVLFSTSYKYFHVGCKRLDSVWFQCWTTKYIVGYQNNPTQSL